MSRMILFSTLVAILILVILLGMIVIGAGGIAFIMLFGDVIACMAITMLIVKIVRRFKNK